MKKIITVLSLSSLIFTACKKNEQIAPTPNQSVITSSSTNTTPTNTTPNRDSVQLLFDFCFLTPDNFKLSYNYDTNNIHILLNGIKIPYNKLSVATNINGTTLIKNTKILKFCKGDTITFKVDSLIYRNDNDAQYSGYVRINGGSREYFNCSGNSEIISGVKIGRFIGQNAPYNQWYVGVPFTWGYKVR